MQVNGSNLNLQVDFLTVQGEISYRRHRKIWLWVHDVWVKMESLCDSPGHVQTLGHPQDMSKSTEHS